MKTWRQSLNEMFFEGDRISLARVMAFLWFALMIITIFRVTGRHHDMSEPVVTAIFYFEAGTFALLLGYCFAGKTKLNFKNFKDGFDIDRDNTVPTTTTATTTTTTVKPN